MAGPGDATPVVEAQKRAPADYKRVVDFLRGKHGPKVRRGILNGKRIDYFKGKTAIRVLAGPQYAKLKKVPTVANEDEAKELLAKVLPHAFFLRVTRPDPATPLPPSTPKPLSLSPTQSLDPQAYYAWFYEGSPLYTILGGLSMVIIMLAGVMFPLWPVKLRIGVWYLSVGALGLVGAFMGLAVVRLVLWVGTSLGLKRAIWLFPNLFEDVGFVDSFIPTWSYDEPKRKKKRPTGTSSSSSKKSSKSAKSVSVGNGEGDGIGSGVEDAAEGGVEVLKNPAEVVQGGSQGIRNRQSATVEEIDDEE